MIKEQKSNSGQAIIELAFVLPFVLILLLGLIEFGIIFYNKAMIVNASREGARAGIVYRNDASGNYTPYLDDDIEKVVQDYLDTRLITFGNYVKPTIDDNPITGTSPYYILTGGTCDVVVHYTHTYLVFGRFLGLGDSIELTGQTIMRLE